MNASQSGWPALVPELIVSDLQASLHFWRDLVGFHVAYDRPEHGFVYLHLNGAQIMLEQSSKADRTWLTAELETPFGRGINIQLEVDDLDAIIRRLAEFGWPLFMQPEEKWYRRDSVETGQRQFLVQDPDGYLLRPSMHIGERAVAAL